MTKILLVEDDKSLREIYGVRLLAEGYDIVSAGDGEEALAMAIKEKPNLIVSDVMMPKISGFDMLDILRSTTETREIKVIMMTALSSDDQRARGEQLGADRYLVKSQVGIEDVVRTVHEVLGDGGSVSSTPAPQAQPVAADPTPATDTPVQAASTTVDVATDATAPASAAPAPEPTQTVADMSTPDSAPDTSLPQPTAPFSSPRPATLGERVINPLESPAPTVSSTVASQIEQELQSSTEPVGVEPINPAPSDPQGTSAFQMPAIETTPSYEQIPVSQPSASSVEDTPQQPQQSPQQPQPVTQPQPPFPPQA